MDKYLHGRMALGLLVIFRNYQVIIIIFALLIILIAVLKKEKNNFKKPKVRKRFYGTFLELTHLLIKRLIH